jgi:pilus assembly protein Flp/PilA
MKAKLKAFIIDESGQTSTEYILLVAIVAIVIYRLKGTLESKLTGDNGLLGRVFGKVDELVDQLQ